MLSHADEKKNRELQLYLSDKCQEGTLSDAQGRKSSVNLKITA